MNLLYRSDLGPQRFAARLSEQSDAATMMRLAREAFAATKFGNRTHWLWRPYDDHTFQDADRLARLAVAMPGRYLIEAITDPGRKPAVIACNGQRMWRTYPDAAARSPRSIRGLRICWVVHGPSGCAVTPGCARSGSRPRS